MEQKSKITLIFAVIFIVLGILFIVESQNVGKLRLIFCDVGQGDGILIVTPKGKQVVVDGGPGTKIIDCLGKKMPFWDRTVEMMIMTHPQKDHMEGQIEIFKKYNVQMVGWTGVENETAVIKEWKKLLVEEGSEVFITKSGVDIDMENLLFDIVWPTHQKLDDWKILAPQDLNDSSIVFRLNYGDFCAYFTGDLPKEILEDVSSKSCDVLKVSHHGSKTGTNQKILDAIDPEVAIIQVGKNRFGHPDEEVIDLLDFNRVEIFRNDKNGIIEIESDGSRFSTRISRQSN